MKRLLLCMLCLCLMAGCATPEESSAATIESEPEESAVIESEPEESASMESEPEESTPPTSTGYAVLDEYIDDNAPYLSIEGVEKGTVQFTGSLTVGVAMAITDSDKNGTARQYMYYAAGLLEVYLDYCSESGDFPFSTINFNYFGNGAPLGVQLYTLDIYTGATGLFAPIIYNGDWGTAFQEVFEADGILQILASVDGNSGATNAQTAPENTYQFQDFTYYLPDTWYSAENTTGIFFYPTNTADDKGPTIFLQYTDFPNFDISGMGSVVAKSFAAELSDGGETVVISDEMTAIDGVATYHYKVACSVTGQTATKQCHIDTYILPVNNGFAVIGFLVPVDQLSTSYLTSDFEALINSIDTVNIM